MRINQLFFLFFLLIFFNCVEEYPPPVSNEHVDFLVVDGNLNSSLNTVEVRLSRAISLDSDGYFPVELNAKLRIEDEEGSFYQLSDFGNGVYRNDNIVVNIGQKYRLRIERADGREYFSEYVSMKKTPPIDSVVWRPNQFRDAIQIMVNTHDESNNTIYYQWTLEETYEYQSAFLSLYKYENEEVVDIKPEDYVNRCWRTVVPTRIIVGSSERLNKDVIANLVVNEIPVGSQKLVKDYSVLVKQRALSKEAYTYWVNLQKSTENLGGLFDPQPGKVKGNMFNIEDRSETVIGYFDINEVQEKRIFIHSRDLPDGMQSVQDIMGCRMDSVSLAEVGKIGVIPGLSLISPIMEGITIIGYTYSGVNCTDCRFQGGTTERPLFWN